MKPHTVKEVFARFQSVSSVCKAKTLLRKAGILHGSYSFYTTLDRAKGLLCNRRMWLTRLDSDTFDDTIEHRKYGDTKEQQRTFIRCLSFGDSESAAMWGLYCSPTYQAIRISFTKTAIQHLCNQAVHRIENDICAKDNLEVSARFVSDILYASVKGEGDAKHRSNSLYWNGAYTKKKIDKLEEHKSQKTVTGFVKDSEWRFENESRLFVKTREVIDSKHIAIDVPDESIHGMSFTLSPWLDEDESEFVEQLLRKWLKQTGCCNILDSTFKKSTLSGGLERWKERRGL